ISSSPSTWHFWWAFCGFSTVARRRHGSAPAEPWGRPGAHVPRDRRVDPGGRRRPRKPLLGLAGIVRAAAGADPRRRTQRRGSPCFLGQPGGPRASTGGADLRRRPRDGLRAFVPAPSRGGSARRVLRQHGHDHFVLPGLPPPILKNELETSKRLLEDRVGVEVGFLAAPYGLLDRRVLDTAREVGYRAVCGSLSWPARPGAATVNRVPVYRDTTAARFAAILGRQPSAFLPGV